MVNLPMRRPADWLPPHLREFFRQQPEPVIALSGGIDSRFLCHAAQLSGASPLAVHVAGPHMPPAESGFARAWARRRGLNFREIAFDPLAVPEVRRNGRQRCYACKSALFAAIFAQVRPDKAQTVCDGGNADDFRTYRPGLRAVAEWGVRSPLAGISKKMIRSLARRTGLDFPEQKARPCLLTRLAYGMRPDAATLARLAGAEGDITGLFADISAADRPDFRLRLTPEPVLHLTRALPQRDDAIRSILQKHGFGACHVAVLTDLSGYFDRGYDLAAP